ncbi:hypothetical protein ACFYUK_19030 [Nonomuraea wenchangensis]
MTPDVAALDVAAVEALKNPGMAWEVVLPDGSRVFRPGEQWYVAFRVAVSATTYRWAVEHFIQPPKGATSASTPAQDAAQALVEGGNTVVVRRYTNYQETTTVTYDGATVTPAEW